MFNLVIYLDATQLSYVELCPCFDLMLHTIRFSTVKLDLVRSQISGDTLARRTAKLVVWIPRAVIC